MSLPLGRTRRRSTAARACRARSGSAAPEITAQACGRASIWHSSFWAEPSGAVVEVGAAVPAAVPGVFLQRGPQRLGPLPAPGRTRRVANLVGQVRERLQHGDEEPAVPDTLALAVGTDLIHAVVPVAGAHQGQTVRPEPVALL